MQRPHAFLFASTRADQPVACRIVSENLREFFIIVCPRLALWLAVLSPRPAGCTASSNGMLPILSPPPCIQFGARFVACPSAHSAMNSALRLRIFRRALCADADFAAELGLRRSSLTKKLASSAPRRAEVEPPPQLEGPIARVSTARLRPDTTADVLTTLYNSKARAIYEDSDGFVGSLLLFDQSNSNARSVTLWADQQAMDGVSSHPDYASTMGEVASHFAAAPDSETWRVGASFFKSD